MDKNLKILTTLLLVPLSKIYGWVMALRNKFFDWGIFKQESFDIPVVVVGNIAIGGTGKTPHVEYLISILCSNYKIGVISRGYKRHTKGFVMASATSTPNTIGDEPYQIMKKFFGRISLAVCENRRHGIHELLKINPQIDLILLDDAFQHRYVKPSVAIVLMEYNRPVFNDKLLPLGRLRESVAGLNRAEMVIVTKCPQDLKPMDFRIMKNNLNLFPSQQLLFSKYKYGNLVSVFPDYSMYMPYMEWMKNDDSILAITGIANPKPFVKYIKSFEAKVKVIHFADHHNFDRSDLDLITTKFNQLTGEKKLIITTEKDAVRLANNPYFPTSIKANVFYLPIEVDFIPYDDVDFRDAFEKEITNAMRLKNANKLGNN
ncbi:MAG: tetraacyldisaccharide 4'-kinase [Muribaculaceae bacterium]